MDDESKIIPGHGPLASRADLIAYRNMLQQANDAVAPMGRRGASLQEIEDADPLSPLVEEWGGGFINAGQFLELIMKGMAN